MNLLDQPDIQGNIRRPYGRFGFPHSRHLLFNIGDPAAGRFFVDQVRPNVTTAEPWQHVDIGDGTMIAKPKITLNIGFTWHGLLALDLPTTTLRSMPDEFIDGMACRAHILGDLGDSAPEKWDRVWQPALDEPRRQVHIWVSLNVAANPDGTPVALLEDWTNWLKDAAQASGGVALLAGHGVSEAQWQDSSALMMSLPDGTRRPIAKEHFGFTDGIGDPTFAEQYAEEDEANRSLGSGKIMPGPYDPARSWQPLATGEFILGHPDEGQELPVSAAPPAFMRNGTFMAFRKLQQHIGVFEEAIKNQAAVYQSVAGFETLEEARETLRAKMVGRWSNGIPLMVAPTYAEAQAEETKWAPTVALYGRLSLTKEERGQLAAYERMLVTFRYGTDIDGTKCPLSSHIRRSNPRDMLDPEISAKSGATTLTNRRRVLRRGLPYGTRDRTDGEHGVVFMALCASLFRQFEFVQQQWIHYGLDSGTGNDTCPLIGNRDQSDKFVIASDPSTGRLPFIASGLPPFVTTRGGEYFFIPSLTALRMISMGTTDPT